jgi:hypothetical protein
VLRDLKVDYEQGVAGGLNTTKIPEGGLLSNIRSTFSLDPSVRGAPGGSAVKVNARNYAITRGSVVFTSSYGGFKAFLNDIEKSLTLINVTELSFSPRKDGAKKSVTSLYDFKMEVETYSIK